MENRYHVKNKSGPSVDPYRILSLRITGLQFFQTSNSSKKYCIRSISSLHLGDLRIKKSQKPFIVITFILILFYHIFIVLPSLYYHMAIGLIIIAMTNSICSWIVFINLYQHYVLFYQSYYYICYTNCSRLFLVTILKRDHNKNERFWFSCVIPTLIIALYLPSQHLPAQS